MSLTLLRFIPADFFILIQLYRVTYTFQVPTTGKYQIQGWVYANDEDGFSDSFWVQVDGEPASGYLWDIASNTSYAADDVNHRDGADPVVVTLSAGQHSVEMSLRDDGMRLDKIGLVAADGCGGMSQEAEYAELSGAFVVAADPGASSEKFIYVPNGATETGNDRATFCFDVPAAGLYRVAGKVYAENGEDDTFYVKVDGEPSNGYLWDLQWNTAYEVDYLNDRTTASDPVEVSLSAGQHTLEVLLREDGARLDTLALEPVAGGIAPQSFSPGLSTSGGGKLYQLAQVKFQGDRAKLVKRAANRLVKAAVVVPPPDGTVYRSYYYAGGQRVALRETTSTGSAVYYLLSDHLGSTHRTIGSDGQPLAELRYRPWGGLRHSSGQAHTDYRYTGQRFDSSGLYFYSSRWYDPYITQFTQPDAIIPDPYNPLDWNRYAYVRYNPLRYTDPTGHYSEEEIFKILEAKNGEEVYKLFRKGGKYEGSWGILDILRMANDGDRFLDSFDQFDANVVGEFRLIDGQLYLEKDGIQTLALSVLAGGEYDHTAIEQYVPILGGWSRTATYIFSSSTHNTWRAEFDSSQVDWVGAGLDSAGIVADVCTVGLAGRFANASKLAYGAGKVIGPVDLAYGVVQTAQQPSFSSGAGLTTDFIGLYVPIIPDVAGLLLNFGNAFRFYP